MIGLRNRIAMIRFKHLINTSNNIFMAKFINKNLPQLVSTALLLGAVIASFNPEPVLPFAYYQLMNWAVAISAIRVAWRYQQKHKDWLMWLFGLVAIVFNPISAIYLSAPAWRIADIIVIIIFILTFFHFKKEKNEIT